MAAVTKFSVCPSDAAKLLESACQYDIEVGGQHTCTGLAMYIYSNVN
jgi:hypothetical protein